MKRQLIRISIGLVIVLLLAGCSGNGEIPPQPPTETVAAVPPTNTPGPTEPEPASPGVVVLVAPVDVSSEKIQGLETAAGAAASARGLVLEKRVEINPQTAPENLLMVAAAANFAGLAEMADAMPEVQFVVVGTSEVAQKPNLTVIGEDGDLRLVQAFLAGYIAAVQSEEYRIGILSVYDSAGQDFRDAFLKGVIYFCGNCATRYPPYEVYPTYEEVAPGADRTVLENAARVMTDKGVNMILVAPSLQDASFYQFLAQNGVRLIGTGAPPTGLESSWVASVMLTSGVNIETVLGAILDGTAAPQSGAHVEISYTGVGEARLAHFGQILSQLNSGAIDPLGKVD